MKHDTSGSKKLAQHVQSNARTDARGDISKAGTSTDVGVVRGTSSAGAGTFSSSDAMNFPVAQTTEATGFASPASVSGTFAPASQMNLTLTTRSGTRTLAANYVTGSDQAPALAAPAGGYTGYNGHIGGRQSATFAIDGAGNISGSNAAGCSYAGTMSPRASVRAFDWTIVSSNNQCIFGQPPISGILYYDEAAHQVHAFALFNDGAVAADQYFVIGTKN
jgi:hypothetical protein